MIETYNQFSEILYKEPIILIAVLVICGIIYFKVK